MKFFCVLFYVCVCVCVCVCERAHFKRTYMESGTIILKTPACCTDGERFASIWTSIDAYLPTANQEKKQMETLSKIKEELDDFQKDNIFIGGDFNLHLNKILDIIFNTNQGFSILIK